jgi:hypothetical protein
MRLGKNTSGQYKKEKKEILNTLDTLDKKAENTPLRSEEISIKQCLNNRLAHLLREEEMKWYQHAKTKVSKWFYSTFSRAATGAARCGSFTGNVFILFGCSL